ncbi:MAG: DivIVA domain-containing protein [Ignavibacteriales bacterium]|nr:DivIVA domain-containing protein [Ignavibacteriales bacterium]
MNISVSEIRSHKFNTKLSGFDKAEVSAFLSKIADEMNELNKINGKLSEKVIELETRLKDYQTIEKALQQTLMQGQETAGKTVEIARKEAQLILQEAEVKASQILDKARTELTSTKEQITILKAKKDSIVSRMRMLLNSELELIKALEFDEKIGGGIEMEAKSPTVEKSAEIDEIIKQIG